MKYQLRLWSVTMSFALLGCAGNKMSFEALDERSAQNVQNEAEDTDNLSCLATAADYSLETNLVSFEMNSTTSGQVGFSLSGLLNSIGLGASYSSGHLLMSMHLRQPLKSTISLLDETGSGTLKRVDMNAAVSVWLASLKFDSYSQTPLATLSANAIKDTLSNLVRDLRGSQALETPWSTVVTKVIDEQSFLIPVGKNAGLREKDVLALTSVKYEWAGKECASSLVMARKLSNVPYALAMIRQVDTGSAYLEIIQRNADDPLAKYSQVEVAALQPDEQGRRRNESSLGRSVHLLGVTQSQPLQFQTKEGALQNVDLTADVEQQISTLLRQPEYGDFFIR